MNKLAIKRGTIPQAFFDAYDFRPATADTYRRELSLFAEWLFDNGITQPTPADVAAYRDEMAATLKNTTLRNRVMALKRFFTWTAQTGQYPNIAANLRTPKVSREFKKDFLTVPEMVQLLDSIDTHSLQGARDRAIVNLMLTAGLRDVEISRAKIKHLEKIGGEWWLNVWGKGRDEADRRNRVTEPEVLTAYLDRRFNGGPWDPEAPLFETQSNRAANGGHIAPGSISRIVKNRLRNIGIDTPRITAHSLRHTAAAQAIEEGEGIEAVAEMLGHSSTTITKVYTHDLQRRHNRAEFKVKAAMDRERERRKKI